MNRNTDVGPVHAFGSRTTRQNSSEGSRGGKRPLEATVVRPLEATVVRPLEATVVRPFYTGPTLGVLLDLQHLVDRMLMKTSTIPQEGV
jgi:hypothetical protein